MLVAEEKVQLYEGRRTASADQTPEDAIKQLETDLAKTRASLVAAKEDLNLERERMETFKSISQASEERLIELNSTYDLYKAETDATISELNQKLEAAELEVEDLKSRLNRAVAEVTEGQEKLDSERVAFEKDKKDMLEAIKLIESQVK